MNAVSVPREGHIMLIYSAPLWGMWQAVMEAATQTSWWCHVTTLSDTDVIRMPWRHCRNHVCTAIKEKSAIKRLRKGVSLLGHLESRFWLWNQVLAAQHLSGFSFILISFEWNWAVQIQFVLLQWWRAQGDKSLLVSCLPSQRQINTTFPVSDREIETCLKESLKSVTITFKFCLNIFTSVFFLLQLQKCLDKHQPWHAFKVKLDLQLAFATCISSILQWGRLSIRKHNSAVSSQPANKLVENSTTSINISSVAIGADKTTQMHFRSYAIKIRKNKFLPKTSN